MDPLVNVAAVDAFFDQPGDDLGFESAPIDNSFGVQDTSVTNYYSPSAAPSTQASTQEAPEQTPDTPEETPIDFAAENAALKAQLAELKLYQPLGEMIQRNPQFLQAVEGALKQAPQGEAAPAIEAPKIERPAPPVKPATFDPAEAYLPGTESFKYREAMEQYPLQIAEYVEKRDALRDEMIRKEQEQIQRTMQEQQARAQLSQQLATTYNYKPADIDDFIKVMSDPNSRSLQNLVALHQMTRKTAVAGAAGAAKAAQKNVPLPVGIAAGGGGGQQRQLTDSDAFNSGLMAARRK